MIRELIERIEAATVERCDTVDRTLDQVASRGHSVLPSQLPHERLFAALVTGKPGLVGEGPWDAAWVSWIEDVPPHYWLQQFERVVIDLIPCNAHDFEKKYGIAIRDFVWWVERFPESVLINVRNDAWEEYDAPDVRQGMQRILALADSASHAGSFYRLQPIRSRAFRRLDVPFDKYLADARKVVENYERPSEAVAERLRVVTREGRWLAKGQLAGRIAYYRTAKHLWDGRDGFAPAADEVLDAWLGEGDRSVSFDQTEDEMLELQARLYTVHHLYTAHLTGALGGRYGWMAHELDFASSVRTATRGGVPHGVDLDLPAAEWFYQLEAGYVAKPGETEIPFPPGVHQVDGLTPFQWFITNAAHNRGVVQGNIRQLEDILRRCSYIIASHNPGALDGAKVEISRLMSELAHHRLCPSKCVLAIGAVLGVSLSIGNISLLGAKVDDVLKIVVALGGVDKFQRGDLLRGLHG